MEDQKIRFDADSRELLRSCMDELQNDTIKVVAENMLGGTAADVSKTHPCSFSWTKTIS
jgi:hypothetical protein